MRSSNLFAISPSDQPSMSIISQACRRVAETETGEPYNLQPSSAPRLLPGYVVESVMFRDAVTALTAEYGDGRQGTG